MKLKCTRYNVDPRLLRVGVPVDQLEKFNVREFNPTAEEQERLFSRPSTAKAKKVVDDKARSAYPATEVTEAEYNRILMRKTIHASEDILVHVGKKIKVVNQNTGAHLIRTLVLVGDRTAYFT